MARIAQVIGTRRVIANIRRRTATMGAAYSKGIRIAGLYLQRESQRLVPVDTGNLKASAFTRANGLSWNTEVTVGYTAAYALYVHEAVGMKLKGQDRPPPSKGQYWDPQGRAQAKFLEEPARRLTPELRKIIQNTISRLG